MENNNVVARLKEALRFAQGEEIGARVTQYDGLPPRPWNWVTSDSASANGAFHIYLVDATGRKIAALWGKGGEKQAMAEHIVALVSERQIAVDAMTATEDGIREAVRVLDLMGRGNDARDLARHGNNLRATLRELIDGWETGTDATEADELSKPQEPK